MGRVAEGKEGRGARKRIAKDDKAELPFAINEISNAKVIRL